MNLPRTRRDFLAAATGAAGTAFLISECPTVAALQRTPQPLPSPNAPTNQNVPGGLNNYPSGDSSRPVPNTFNAAEVKRMVEELYQLALELKDEADKTNLQTTLPADFLKRAQQIEKLAKAVRNRARS